jgi:hypothetical protein
MKMSLDPYEAVLADLRAKRDRIDYAIATIEAIRSEYPRQNFPKKLGKNFQEQNVISQHIDHQHVDEKPPPDG